MEQQKLATSKHISNIKQFKALLEENAINGLNEEQCLDFFTLWDRNIEAKRISIDYLSEQFCIAIQNGHTKLLETIAIRLATAGFFMSDKKIKNKPLKRKLQFALIHSGSITLKNLRAKNNGSIYYDCYLILPNNEEIKTKYFGPSEDVWQKDFTNNVVIPRLNFFPDTYDEELRLSSPPTLAAPPASDIKYSAHILMQARGLGIAANVAHASVWHEHEERFVELLH